MGTNDRHVLEARGLTLRRGERVLARGFGLAVRSGETVVVRGVSGSGKTTLLRVLAGLIPPDAGRVELDGQPPGAFGWPQFRSRVTYVGQQPVFVEGTVRDNLARPFRYRNRTAAYPEGTALQWLEAWSLSAEMLEQSAAHLSIGEQQRVALVRALVTEPWFLLLDEPTSALDARTGKRVLRDLAREAERGRIGIVMVSHDETLLDALEAVTLDFPGAAA